MFNRAAPTVIYKTVTSKIVKNYLVTNDIFPELCRCVGSASSDRKLFGRQIFGRQSIEPIDQMTARRMTKWQCG